MHPDLTFATDLIQTEPLPIVRHPLIIGEIGINHNGDVAIAKQLIDMVITQAAMPLSFKNEQST